MSKEISFTVQGQQVNTRVIAAYAKRVGTLDDILSVWANAATLQIAVHGNRKWIDSLFSMPVLTLKAGGLSKAGKEVLSYIQAHCPRVVLDKETGKIGMTKLAKDSVLATAFVAPNATEEDVAAGIFQVRSKFYKAHGDFSMTLNEFRNIEKAEKEVEEKLPSMTAKAFVKQAEKALECFKEQRFVGTPDELLAASLRAKALYLELDAAFTAADAIKNAKLAESGVAATPADALDVGKAAELLKSGQGGKSARAGGKVEKATA